MLSASVAPIVTSTRAEQLCAAPVKHALAGARMGAHNRHFGPFWAVFKGLGCFKIHYGARTAPFRCARHTYSPNRPIGSPPEFFSDSYTTLDA